MHGGGGYFKGVGGGGREKGRRVVNIADCLAHTRCGQGCQASVTFT